MLDIINKLLANDIFQWVLVGVIVLNAALSGLAKGLELIGKAQIPWVSKIASVLQKIVEFLSANLPHKK